MKLKVFLILSVVALGASPALAQFESGSDGSDGAFNPTVDVEVDLGLATTATWDTPSPVPGNGVYDSEKWAVVFKYTSIDIPDGVTVTFKNHPKGAPVIWLASGDVTISGVVSLDGANGAAIDEAASFAEPGPGGFAGGRRGINPVAYAWSDGLGVGGGYGHAGTGSGGGYGTNGDNNWNGNLPGGSSYGNDWILPLIGGSGGSGARTDGGSGDAGAGGGAILIASSGHITLVDGTIRANGGYGKEYTGGGSGGAIRILADRVSGQGTLSAQRGCHTFRGACGGHGRIRVEAYVADLIGPGTPAWTFSDEPGPVFLPHGAPTLRLVSIAEAAVPDDPAAGITTTDLSIATNDVVTVNIEATGVPVGTTVQVRVVPEHGSAMLIDSTPLEDVGQGLLAATASVTFPPGRTEIQLKANWTP